MFQGTELGNFGTFKLTEIDDDFQAMIARPGDSQIKEGLLPLVIRLSSTYIKCPVANRQPDMIETKK